VKCCKVQTSVCLLLCVCGQGWSTHTPSALELAGAAHSKTHVALFWDVTVLCFKVSYCLCKKLLTRKEANFDKQKFLYPCRSLP